MSDDKPKTESKANSFADFKSVDGKSLNSNNSYSMYDSGPNPQDVARRLGLSVPDSTGHQNASSG